MAVKPVINNEYTCERCGHVWRGRCRTLPVSCARCRNLLWNVPREPESGKVTA